ncbi:MAG: IPT/TIG domain-containing protein [Bryobacteraceae bacterium]
MRFLFAVLWSLPLCDPAATCQTRAASALAGATHSDSAPVSSSPTLAVTAVNIPANSLAWDPVYQKIYLSLPSADGANGNAIQVMDPVTGVLSANIFAGSEPDLLAVSSTSQYLYVGLDGSSSVQRLTLPNLATDIKIELGSGSNDGAYFASDLQASPTSDGTVAVVRSVTGESPAEEGGVVIYDNGAARSNALCGFIQIGCVGNTGGFLFDSIQWNSDASVMFAANNEDTGFDFYTIPVTASGFGKVTDYGGLAGGFGSAIHFDRVTKYVYDDNGAIIDPVAGAKVGVFDASGLMTPDGSLGTAFFLGQSFEAYGSGTYTVTSFNMQRLTPIATVTISNVIGSPTHLIRWGSNGLAFTTTNSVIGTQGSAVYILSGSFVSPPSGAMPAIAASGVAPVGSSSNIVQPGEWVSIYGSNLASSSVSWNGNFPTSLGGSSVTVDGKAAYLSYVSPAQINLQVPNDTTTGPVPVVVTNSSGSATSTVTLAPFAPSLPLLDSKHVAAIIFRSNGSGAYGGGAYDIVGPTGTSLGYPTVAAKAGDSVALFALGLGPTNPSVSAGQPFSSSAPTTNPVTLLVNGVSVTLAFAGLSGAGLYQLNFTVPAGLGSGDTPLWVFVGGMLTPSGAVISLQ